MAQQVQPKQQTSSFLDVLKNVPHELQQEGTIIGNSQMGFYCYSGGAWETLDTNQLAAVTQAGTTAPTPNTS